MNLFDIVGPVMVGPSSSHTAGAAKIGFVARKLLGEPVQKAEIVFHGSFLSTGKGHGTDRAIVAGLLGYSVDDKRIPYSFEEAEKAGLQFKISGGDFGDVHPNTVGLTLFGSSGKVLHVMASSIGGGRIEICELDGLKAKFSAECPTLLVSNKDKPGLVACVAAELQKCHINIATMQVYRSGRGDLAMMVIECDEAIPDCAIASLRNLKGVEDLRYV